MYQSAALTLNLSSPDVFATAVVFTVPVAPVWLVVSNVGDLDGETDSVASELNRTDELNETDELEISAAFDNGYRVEVTSEIVEIVVAIVVFDVVKVSPSTINGFTLTMLT